MVIEKGILGNNERSVSRRSSIIIMLFFLVLSIPFGVLHTKVIRDKFISRFHAVATIGAKQASFLFEGMDKLDMFDTDYKRIGYDEFSRDYCAGPISDEYYSAFPGKFHTLKTSYDTNAELVTQITRIQESFLVYPDIEFALCIDKNGYVPVHHLKNRKLITGDLKKDIYGNRDKRILPSLAHEQVIMGEVYKANKMYEYERDTGKTYMIAAAPIYIKGELWGSFIVSTCTDNYHRAVENMIMKIFTAILSIGLLVVLLLPVMFKFSRKRTIKKRLIIKKERNIKKDGV